MVVCKFVIFSPLVSLLDDWSKYLYFYGCPCLRPHNDLRGFNKTFIKTKADVKKGGGDMRKLLFL